MDSRDDVSHLVPHRYPILLVDRIVSVTPGTALIARKCITRNEPWYQGLPPGADLAYPSVLLVESWSQAAGVLVMGAFTDPGFTDPAALEERVMLFGGMTDVRFRRDVHPGEVVEHHVRLVRALGDTVFCEGETLVGEQPVMEVGRVVLAARPAAELHGRASVASSNASSHKI